MSVPPHDAVQCGHCKQLAPAWEQAAKALKGIVGIGAVDCDVHKDLAGETYVQSCFTYLNHSCCDMGT